MVGSHGLPSISSSMATISSRPVSQKWSSVYRSPMWHKKHLKKCFAKVSAAVVVVFTARPPNALPLPRRAAYTFHGR